MEPIYTNVILWAVFLFLSTISYGEIVVRLLNREYFMVWLGHRILPDNGTFCTISLVTTGSPA